MGTADKVGEGSQGVGEMVGNAAGGANVVTDLTGAFMTATIEFLSAMTWYEFLCIAFVMGILFMRSYVKRQMASQTYSGGYNRRYKY